MQGFHLHVDALTLSNEFEQQLTQELGFWRTDFCGHPEGAEAFEPPNHLTQKPSSSEEFRAVFDKVVDYAKSNDAMKGYLEGEYVALDKDIEQRLYDPSVQPPIKLACVSLPRGNSERRRFML